jgi:VIT1/CCC1 family predicted Fe2+/Mn2+ transporter
VALGLRRQRLLDPIERVSEVIFGLIMVLTFTGTLSAADPDRVEIRSMIVSALGCNVAWGIVDAMMYLMAVFTERARERVSTERSRPQLEVDDWMAALAVFLLVFLSTLPVVVPFILMEDAIRALRVSNAVAITMLFLCGYSLGRHASWRPWRTGAAMAIVGSGLVAITIALGG